MLYTPFRLVMRRYATAVRALESHIGAEFLEEPASKHAALIELRNLTQRWMRIMSRHFPREPPEGLGEETAGFGPVLHPDDVRLATSVMLPLALALGNNVPTESYGPVAFLREKCEVLTSTIEVCVGGRAYETGTHRTKWRGFTRRVPEETLADVVRVVPRRGDLARLLSNIGQSAERCGGALESMLGKKVEDL